MVKKVLVLSMLVVFVIGLNGCATARKKNDLEVQGLRNQVSLLETQVQEKDSEINNLREALVRAEEQKQASLAQVSKKKALKEGKHRFSTKDVQVALKNAGFYTGTIDGRDGRMTKEAIKAFQTANNLRPDGRVGKQTWNLLKEHLTQKTK